MMLHRMRSAVVLSFVVGLVPATACVGVEELPEDELALEAELDLEAAPTAEVEMSELLEMSELDSRPSCPTELTVFPSDEGLADRAPEEVAGEGPRAQSSYDIYFHPNNGARGGWIEAWRLCGSNNQYRICRGGWAPVRYWNPSSCGGTVHDWYPQGWHGWAQTGGGCG